MAGMVHFLLLNAVRASPTRAQQKIANQFMTSFLK
jgi:hypothetical protein